MRRSFSKRSARHARLDRAIVCSRICAPGCVAGTIGVVLASAFSWAILRYILELPWALEPELLGIGPGCTIPHPLGRVSQHLPASRAASLSVLRHGDERRLSPSGQCVLRQHGANRPRSRSPKRTAMCSCSRYCCRFFPPRSILRVAKSAARHAPGQGLRARESPTFSSKAAFGNNRSIRSQLVSRTPRPFHGCRHCGAGC